MFEIVFSARKGHRPVLLGEVQIEERLGSHDLHILSRIV